MDKLYTPPSMVGMLLAHMHLLGHKGVNKNVSGPQLLLLSEHVHHD
jgi:hypothetical protein